MISAMSVMLAQEKIPWADQTSLHFAGMGVVLAASFLILLSPRRWVSIILLLVACFLPTGQRVVFASLDFTALRIVVLSCWFRFIARSESRFAISPLDWLVLAWCFTSLTMYVITHGTMTAVIYKCGEVFDALGLYLAFRLLLKSEKDLRYAFFGLSCIAPIVLGCFAIEAASGKNPFSFLGGVPPITDIREGRIRCQGAFPHSILAGSFWAATAPLFAAQAIAGHGRRLASFVAFFSSLGIVLMSASSTPTFALLCGLATFAFFWLRRYAKMMFFALILSAIAIHLLMRPPIWHLLGRVQAVGGSTGWHRFFLIDETVNHFPEWALHGTPSTAHWGAGLDDVTSQYVLEAVQGGLPRLLLFLSLVLLSLRLAVKFSMAPQLDRNGLLMSWSLGASLVVHCVSFIGVAYFGQVWILWWLLLACIAALNSFRPRAIAPKTSDGDREADVLQQRVLSEHERH